MQAEKSLATIVKNRSQLVEKDEQMMQLEEDSYELTITNQAKVAVREKMIELLPEMVNAVQRGTPQQKGVADNLLKAVR